MSEKNLMEVRCCCNPHRLLGWMEIPQSLVNGIVCCERPDDVDPDVVSEAKTHSFLISALQLYGRPTIAVKNPDIPIETLRRVVGFVEATDEDRARVRRRLLETTIPADKFEAKHGY